VSAAVVSGGGGGGGGGGVEHAEEISRPSNSDEVNMRAMANSSDCRPAAPRASPD